MWRLCIYLWGDVIFGKRHQPDDLRHTSGRRLTSDVVPELQNHKTFYPILMGLLRHLIYNMVNKKNYDILSITIWVNCKNNWSYSNSIYCIYVFTCVKSLDLNKFFKMCKLIFGTNVNFCKSRKVYKICRVSNVTRTCMNYVFIH